MSARSETDQTQSLREVSRELRRVNRSLHQLARTGARRSRPARTPAIDADAVRAIFAVRRLRDEHFEPPLDDDGWAILLEAFAARLDGRLSAISALGIAAGIARSTAHRRATALLDRGLLVRDAGRSAGRAAMVGLSDDAARRIADFLATAAKTSLWLF